MKRDGRSIVLRNHFPSPPAGKSAITTAGDVFYSLLPNIARPIQRTELSPQGYIYIYAVSTFAIEKFPRENCTPENL